MELSQLRSAVGSGCGLPGHASPMIGASKDLAVPAGDDSRIAPVRQVLAQAAGSHRSVPPARREVLYQVPPPTRTTWTVSVPSRSGPGARLFYSPWDQRSDGVTGLPTPFSGLLATSPQWDMSTGLHVRTARRLPHRRGGVDPPNHPARDRVPLPPGDVIGVLAAPGEHCRPLRRLSSPPAVHVAVGRWLAVPDAGPRDAVVTTFALRRGGGGLSTSTRDKP